MNSFRPLPIILLFMALAVEASAQPSANWHSSLSEAQAAGKREKRPILLLFTGSDWCPWSKRLQREVLASTAFTNFARTHLILVEIDFPRLKPIPLEQHHQNLMLAQRFGVTGLPTVILLDSSGEKLTELGFSQAGPDSFVARIQPFLPRPTATTASQQNR